MCGIVGYCGPKDPKQVIYDGLKTLEYRGYDSAGVSILDHGDFKRVRAEGKLAALKDKLEVENFDGHLGIGHTRWATHGEPSERNAHPHSFGGVSIVHNGIIENYTELRDKLKKKGADFESDTDSELVAHLLAEKLTEGCETLLQAVFQVVPMLKGAYAVLAVHNEEPDTLIAFKHGPPLLLGVADDEMIVASDVQAVIEHTNKVIYLDDDEVVFTKGNHFEIYTAAGDKIEKDIIDIEWSEEKAEKQGYDHFMLKEIFEQPRAVAAAIEPHINLQTNTVQLDRLGFGCRDLNERESVDREQDYRVTQKTFSQVDRIFIVACGTSFYAGMVGEYLIEQIARVPVEIDIASEFRYRKPVITKNSLVIVISQSGETADTLAAVRLAKEEGAQILSICNVKRSSIDRESDGHLYMNAGVEVGVASTKAFVSTLAVFNLLAIELGKSKGKVGLDEEKRYVDNIQLAPHHMETVLSYNTFFAEAAHTLKKYKGFLYMGRGVNFPIAMEGALKLKELAYMHAEGYAAGEMKHGPLALVDEDMAIVMLAPSDELYEKTVSNLEEAKARGGNFISIGTSDNEKLKELSQHYLSLPETSWVVNPLLEVIPLQLLAYHVAKALGHDVDQPRNLAKSVTVE